ncbi:flavodoxin family protein [Oceanivirga salmonicida]|uniref:flavodoxin family protein n=1 Tax=Oceanivirga salmonicida TaxID=1769291 RepID=UPI00082E0312|nr:flavodoxin family protein [Oceanivirga salmonicida]
MKKILFILGSRNPKSKSLIFSKELSEILENSNMKTEIITPTEFNLLPVINGEMFLTGIDNCDNIENDNGNLIKRKLLEADFIIFSSPVYAHAVSSDMKLLIERISHWFHIFRLLGKRSISIVSTSNNGFIEVQEYLKYVMESLGMQVLESVVLLDDNTFNNISPRDIFNIIVDSFSQEYRPIVSKTTEKQFLYYKSVFLRASKDLAEPKYWKQNGMFKYRTLQDYVNYLWDKNNEK